MQISQQEPLGTRRCISIPLLSSSMSDNDLVCLSNLDFSVVEVRRGLVAAPVR